MSKSSKLASEMMAATGLCCLRSSVLAGHPGYSRVTIGGIADRGSRSRRIWFPSSKVAERVIAELFRKAGTRRGDTMVIEVVPDEVDQLLRASARLLGIAVLEDERIDSLMVNLTKCAETAIKAMGREATLKNLRRVTELDDMTRLLSRLS